MSDLSFVQIAPHPALRPYIDFFWVLRNASPTADSTAHLVFPDGGMDIVVNWNVSKSSIATPASPSISGIASHARKGPLQFVAVIVGARLRPGAAFALLSISAPDLKDTLAPLEEVMRRAQRGTFESVTDARSPKECLEQLQKALIARMADAASVDSIVVKSLQTMEARRGSIRDFVELAGTTPDRCFAQSAPVRFFQYTNFDAL